MAVTYQIEKAPGARLDYALDWSNDLGADKITNSVWSCSDPSLSVSESDYTDTKTSVWLSGGQPRTWYTLANTISTDAGRTDQRLVAVFVNGSVLAEAGVSSIFASPQGAVAELRRDRLAQLALQLQPGSNASDDYLWSKLRAAEADAERRLRVFLTPREMVPFSATTEEREALESAGNVVVEEPGYDYDPDLFRGNTWGLIELRQRPLIKVHSIVFAYPEVTSRLWQVPNEWVRPDKRYGRINLVPNNAIMTLPLNSYILSSLGGGRNVPLMMHVRYRAGLENVGRDYPDLLDLVKKMAVLALVNDKLVPQSGSVSADGLSQSISFDADKYHDAIEKKLDVLRQSLHGVRMMVM